MLRAAEYLGPVGRGVTAPALFRADDGRIYVVKSPRNRLGAKVLVNELIAARLGELAGLIFPPGGVMAIGGGLPGGKHRPEPGLRFACLKICGARHLSPTGLKKAVNRREMAGVLLFDHMFFNLDRGRNRRNLIAAPGPEGLRIWAIDNSHLFRRGRWDAAALAGMSGRLVLSLPRLYGTLIRRYLAAEDFIPYTARFLSLDADRLAALVGEVPAAWLPDSSERQALVECLIQRCRRAPVIAGRLASLIPDHHRRADPDKVE